MEAHQEVRRGVDAVKKLLEVFITGAVLGALALELLVIAVTSFVR